MVHGMVATVSRIFVNFPRALSALLSFSPRSLSSSPELADAIRRLQTLKTTKTLSKTRVGAEFARVVKRTRRDEEKTKRGQRAQSDKIRINSRLIRRSERRKMTSFGRVFGAPGDNFRSTWREPRAAKLGSLANDRPEPGDLRKPLEFSKTSLVVIRDDFQLLDEFWRPPGRLLDDVGGASSSTKALELRRRKHRPGIARRSSKNSSKIVVLATIYRRINCDLICILRSRATSSASPLSLPPSSSPRELSKSASNLRFCHLEPPKRNFATTFGAPEAISSSSLPLSSPPSSFLPRSRFLLPSSRTELRPHELFSRFLSLLLSCSVC